MVLIMAIQEALGATDAGLDMAANSPDKKWWHDRISDIHIPRDPYFLGNGAEHYEAVNPLFLELADKVERAASDLRPTASGSIDSPYLVLNPVFAGSLPPEATSALLAGKPIDLLQQVLKEVLPEPPEDGNKWVLSQRRAKQLNTQSRANHSEMRFNFGRVVNIVFIEDQEGVIEELYEREGSKNNTSSYEALLALHRHEIAKTGAYKTVLVPYRINNGRAEARIATVGTLEGGHPKVDVNNPVELTRRLMILGATNDVEPLKREQYALEADPENWQASSVVNGLVRFFRYSAKQGLIDPPVVLKQLIRNEKQADKIGEIVNWSQQQESAGLAYDPMQELWVVTGSGRFKIDKRRLTAQHLTPVWTDGGYLTSGKVKGWDTPRPSVEAQEVLKAQIKLQQLFPYYQDSDTPISPIHSTLHLHRGEDTLNKMVKTHTEHAKVQNNVLWLPPGRDDYDHIGCGMEEMDARTEDAMLRAYGEWEAANRKADFVLWYVANHGMMAAEFIKEGDSFAPLEKIRRAIDEKRISITRSVLQV
jgi:hypothetical protein